VAKRAKGKAKGKRRPTSAASGRVPRITSARLVEGWSGPRGTRVRLVQAGEAGDVARFLTMAGVELEPGMARAIDRGDAGRAVVAALEEGSHALFTEIAQLAVSGDVDAHLPALATVLVAVDRAGELVGALLALPPFSVLSDFARAGIPDEQMLACAAVVVRFTGLGVDESSRGLGVGSALLRGALRLYTQLGYRLIYGQIRVSDGLDRYYPRFGFEVLAPGQGVPLDDMLGVPVGISPLPGEQLIVHWWAPAAVGGGRRSS
jgi:GNAT superfamily N-acetyltransferase